MEGMRELYHAASSPDLAVDEAWRDMIKHPDHHHAEVYYVRHSQRQP
jgi:hypothetical protein